MRYSQLRSFHAVARAGGFTAAARAVHVSQPALTQQVRALEQAFDVELFQRRGRRIQLSEAGLGLFAVTQRLFKEEQEALDFLNESRELRTGHLRVGAVGPFHATDMLAAFSARYPGIYVSVSVGNSRDTVQGLLGYQTDVAVLAHIDPDPRLVAIPYSRHPVIVMAPRHHPLARRRGIRIGELAGQPMIQREDGSTTRRAFEAALRTHGVTPRTVMEIGSREAIRHAVARGIGLGVVSEAEFIPDKRIVALRIVDAEIYTFAHVVHLAERRDSRLISVFMGVVADLLGRTSRAWMAKAAPQRHVAV
jgi:aminoethylphosphonate catabolism LysR family transcriptional regulator